VYVRKQKARGSVDTNAIAELNTSALHCNRRGLCICLLLIFQVEDFLHPEGKISLFREETPVRTDSSLLSSLYFYWVSNDQSGKVLTPSEIRARKTALKCVKVGTLHYRLTYCLKWSFSVAVHGRYSCHLYQIKPFRFIAFPLVILPCHGN